MYPILTCGDPETDTHLFTHYSGISSHSQGSSYKEELVTSVDAFRPKKDHEAVLLLKEWALRILEPDVLHILKWAKKIDSETKEQHNKVKKVDGDKFKFTK